MSLVVRPPTRRTYSRARRGTVWSWFGRAHSDLKTLIGEDESSVRRGEFGGRHCGGFCGVGVGVDVKWCCLCELAGWTPRRLVDLRSGLITRDRSLGQCKFLVGGNVGLDGKTSLRS